MISLIGNLDVAELFVIALVAVMIFGRNLPRVAASAVSNVTKARRALQKVWRESGIGDEIRDVQRELDASARKLRDVDPRTAYRTANREIEAAVVKPVTTNAEEATDDPDYGRAQAETEAAEAQESEGSTGGSDEPAEPRVAESEAGSPLPDEPEAERMRRPPWYPDNLYPPSSSEAPVATPDENGPEEAEPKGNAGDGEPPPTPDPDPDPERGA